MNMHRALCLLLVATLGLASPARAEIPSASAASLDAAYRDLDALTRKTRALGRMPRLSNADEAAILKRVWDVPAILGRPLYAQRDVPLLLAIIEKQIVVFKGYLLFVDKPEAVPDTARNNALFQDEVTAAQAFLVRAVAAVFPAVADFAARLKPGELTEVRRQGLRQTRLGFLEMISGFTLALRSPGLNPGNQVLLVDSLADNAAALASGLTPVDKEAVAANAKTVLANLPPASRTRMQNFIAAMATKDCSGLCAIE